jgi:hypothetical protein
VSQDDSPLLYTIVDGAPQIITYNVSAGSVRSELDDIGFTPQILTVPGE